MNTEKLAKELIGKTILNTELVGHDPENCISINVLKLTMTDGNVYNITGTYGSYDRNVCDEYIEIIAISKEPLHEI